MAPSLEPDSVQGDNDTVTPTSNPQKTASLVPAPASAAKDDDPRENDAANDDARCSCNNNIHAPIVQVVYDRYRSRPSPLEYQGCFKFPLADGDAFELLLDCLQRHDPPLREYFEQCLRSNWSVATGTLSLLLAPQAIHSTFNLQFHDMLRDSIKSLEVSATSRGDHEIAEICSSTSFWGHAGVEGVWYPAFVYEIARGLWDDTDPHQSAHVYMDYLPLHVGSHLAFNFEHDKTKKPNHQYKSSVSFWIARIDRSRTRGKIVLRCYRMLDQVVFRDDGRSLPGTLEIPLEAILPPCHREKYSQHTLDTKIVIDFADLARFAAAAEKRQHLWNMPQPMVPPGTIINFVACDASGNVTEQKRITYNASGNVIEEVSPPAPAKEPCRSRRLAAAKSAANRR